MENTKKMLLWTVRILLSVACAFALGFILYNSIQPAVESARQSGQVVEVVQEVVATIAPESPIATATGEDYDKLHAAVRLIAHFSEYALLGALGAWCYRSYTDKKVWLLLPSCVLAALAVVDECLQLFAEGRGMQFLDIMVDICGGGLGIAVALASVWLVVKVLERRRAHETR